MKRHTHKNIKSFGMGLVALALLSIGVLSFCNPIWAEKKSQEVNVKFTFNPTLNVKVSKDTISISGLSAGTAGQSEPVTISVETNNATGYYLSATAGTKGGNTDLTNAKNGTKFTQLGVSANLDLNAITDNYWGVAYTANADFAASDKYNGLPLDGGDNGVTGKKLLETTEAASNKSVKVKVGAKAGPTLAAGTYTNKINFYAVTK